MEFVLHKWTNADQGMTQCVLASVSVPSSGFCPCCSPFCAVRGPGRGLSTVCPLCVQSTPVLSHRHNCIPSTERGKRSQRSKFSPFIHRYPGRFHVCLNKKLKFCFYHREMIVALNVKTKNGTASGTTGCFLKNNCKLKVEMV